MRSADDDGDVEMLSVEVLKLFIYPLFSYVSETNRGLRWSGESRP
jgi:hypothetical protein